MPKKRSVRSNNNHQNKVTLIVLSCIAAAAALTFAVVYSDYLGARVAPGLKFRILSPSAITPGEKATITWDASTEGTKQYPYEKIEACFKRMFSKNRCVVLASIVANNGKAVVSVPSSLPAGGGQLKLTARDANKVLVGSRVSLRGVTINRKKSVVADSTESGGGNGGGNGGSGSSGNTGGGVVQQVSNPSVDILEPLDNEQLIINDVYDVRVQLKETDASKITCQEWILDGVRMTSAQWEGQPPVLSATACQ